MTKYVDIFTSGGTFTVDVTNSVDQGLLDDDIITAGGSINAVALAFRQGTNLIDEKGNPFIIKAGVIGYRYRSMK